MKFKINISKRFLLQLMLFSALTGMAMAFDYYFESHPVIFKELSGSKEEAKNEQSIVYLLTQTSTVSLKSPVQNTPGRKFLAQEHSKFIQQCHHLRNLQAFKAEKEIPRKPVSLECHNLLFKQNYFSYSDDDPLNS